MHPETWYAARRQELAAALRRLAAGEAMTRADMFSMRVAGTPDSAKQWAGGVLRYMEREGYVEVEEVGPSKTKVYALASGRTVDPTSDDFISLLMSAGSSKGYFAAEAPSLPFGPLGVAPFAAPAVSAAPPAEAPPSAEEMLAALVQVVPALVDAFERIEKRLESIDARAAEPEPPRDQVTTELIEAGKSIAESIRAAGLVIRNEVRESEERDVARHRQIREQFDAVLNRVSLVYARVMEARPPAAATPDAAALSRRVDGIATKLGSMEKEMGRLSSTLEAIGGNITRALKLKLQDTKFEVGALGREVSAKKAEIPGRIDSLREATSEAAGKDGTP